MNKKSPGDEVVFVGADGIERQAWISSLRGTDSPDRPMIDVTFTSPGGKPPPQYSTHPARGPREDEDEDDPKFHPPIPLAGEDKAVPHESNRVWNHSFWRGIVDRSAVTEQVRRELKGKSAEEIQTEIDKRYKVEQDREAQLVLDEREARKQAVRDEREENRAKGLEAQPANPGEDEQARRKRLHLDLTTGKALRMDPAGKEVRDPVTGRVLSSVKDTHGTHGKDTTHHDASSGSGTADYKAGKKAHTAGAKRDTTQSTDWLAGYDAR